MATQSDAFYIYFGVMILSWCAIWVYSIYDRAVLEHNGAYAYPLLILSVFWPVAYPCALLCLGVFYLDKAIVKAIKEAQDE